MPAGAAVLQGQEMAAGGWVCFFSAVSCCLPATGVPHEIAGICAEVSNKISINVW